MLPDIIATAPSSSSRTLASSCSCDFVQLQDRDTTEILHRQNKNWQSLGPATSSSARVQCNNTSSMGSLTRPHEAKPAPRAADEDEVKRAQYPFPVPKRKRFIACCCMFFLWPSTARVLSSRMLREPAASCCLACACSLIHTQTISQSPSKGKEHQNEDYQQILNTRVLNEPSTFQAAPMNFRVLLIRKSL